MIRARTWKKIRGWVAVTTAAAALVAPVSAEVASAVTFDKKGSFAKTGRFEKRTTSAKKSPKPRPKVDPGLLGPRVEPKVAPVPNPKVGPVQNPERDPRLGPKRGRKNPPVADPRAKDPRVEALITRIMTKGDPVSTVAAADRAATQTQLAFRRVVRWVITRTGRFRSASVRKLARKTRRHRRELERSARAFGNAELDLRAKVDSLWNGFGAELDKPTVIDAPLAAAMLQLQIETRRMLGAELHTDVPNLAKMPGCAGDLIAERMIAKYGEAVLDTGADRSGETEILGRIAKQLACISTDQSRNLDHVLYEAYYRVFRRLAKAGLRICSPRSHACRHPS